MKAVLLLVLAWWSFEAIAKNQSCQEFLCATGNAVSSGHAYCNSCGDCARLKRNFCVQSTNRCECLNSIPYSCSLWQPNSTVTHGDRHTFCYVASTTLPPPRARHHKHSVDVVVDRFFDQDEYKPYQFSDLTLYAEFNVDQPSHCDDEILPSRLINDSRCLIFVKMNMPSIDFHGEANDPFYYDDNSPMSISFHTDLLKTSQNVRFWYEVTAKWAVHLARPNQAVSFVFHQYSQVAQLQLNGPVLEKITKRMDADMPENSTIVVPVNAGSESETPDSNSTAIIGKTVHNIIRGNFTQEAELIGAIPPMDDEEVETRRFHHLENIPPEHVETATEVGNAPLTTLEMPVARGRIIQPVAQALEGKEEELETWSVEEAGIHEVYQEYIEEHFYWWVALLVMLLCCSCLVITFFFCVTRSSRHHEPARLGRDMENGPQTRLMG
ncbi:hypothetical protein L596_017822 [Steinernema carpocapsae]|uniref:TNFR-Cys domain-containing protein n=1 Tax=Steinernema carpocapsae TaxID=34508 RepID=A0A4U5N2S2_STECR|nr:hypothetical protein L596_017822 [Steinernema carpocapsae]